MSLTLEEIARCVPHAHIVKGKDKVVAPSPGHSRHARCMLIRLGGSEGFIVASKTEDWIRCKDFVRDCLGLERPCRRRNDDPPPKRQPRPQSSSQEPDQSRIRGACRPWFASEPSQGTITETYLRQARKLELTADVQDLRHIERAAFLLFEDDRTLFVPAMIGLMRGIVSNRPQGVHLTALRSDGSGKAEFRDPKRTHGVAGGAVIKLSANATVTDTLFIAEGLEDALSAINAGIYPVWAAGSAGAIESFPVLDGIRRLTILGDADDRGLNAACACRDQWQAAGRECVILLPPEGFKDWNDAWRAAR
jgi:hypothetical protein